MQLPKYHETFIPILEVLKDGNSIHYNDLRIKVRDKYYLSLPKELLEKKTKSGDLLVLNRIGWGKAYLKVVKAVDQPERAIVRITDKGRKMLEKGTFTLEEMKNDPDFVAHQKAKEMRSNFEDITDDQNASPEDMIDYGVTTIEGQVKTDLLERLKTIDPYYFERVVLSLLDKMGYGEFFETSKSGDGGIDGIINQDQLGLDKIYVQSKRYKENKIRELDIRNFIGAMSGDTTKGVFVTTSEFDEKAIIKAKEAHHKIILIDGLKLADLMHKFNIGVQVRDLYEVKQIDEDFFTNEI
jgi:restriction system protein